MSGGTVLTCKRGGNVFFVSPDSFSAVDFMGVEIMPDGYPYYMEKAIARGAFVKETPKPKSRKKTSK